MQKHLLVSIVSTELKKLTLRALFVNLKGV